MCTAKVESHPTAAIIVIGDEILNGETQDTNSHFLCQELYKCGVKVMRISIIPDCTDTIAEEVVKFSAKYTYVFTSGGIGPTDDDVTYAGIAKAFQEDLVLNKELNDTMRLLCENVSMDAKSVTRMCYVPRSADIHHTRKQNGIFIPIISVRNVFLFPGIPSYFRHTFTYLKYLFLSNVPFHRRYIFLNTNEFNITEQLHDAVEQFGDKVQFGSYPNVESNQFQVKLSMESEAESDLEEAEAYLRNIFPHNCITNPISPKSSESLAQFSGLLQETAFGTKCFVNSLKDSIAVIQECLKQYAVENICLSFNGGKDCTALLHLLICVFMKNSISTKLKAFCVSSEETFPEVEEFIHLCVERYHLDLLRYTYPIKEALAKLKVDHPEIKCILLGIRQTDPAACNLDVFQMTDSNWPQFMRVNPILHWSYNHVWQFLRTLNIPYCSLYDRGYTSLGCKNNTLPNPKLRAVTKNGKDFYYPAYLLKEPNGEREGRSSHCNRLS